MAFSPLTSAAFELDGSVYEVVDHFQQTTLMKEAETMRLEIADSWKPYEDLSPRTKAFMANFGSTDDERRMRIKASAMDWTPTVATMAMSSGVVFDVTMPNDRRKAFFMNTLASDRARINLESFVRMVYAGAEWLNAYGRGILVIPGITEASVEMESPFFKEGPTLGFASAQTIGLYEQGFDPEGQIGQGPSNQMPMVLGGVYNGPFAMKVAALSLSHTSLAENDHGISGLHWQDPVVIKARMATEVGNTLAALAGDASLCGPLTSQLTSVIGDLGLSNAARSHMIPDEVRKSVAAAETASGIMSKIIARAKKGPKPPRVPKLKKNGEFRSCRSFVNIKKPRVLPFTVANVRAMTDPVERAESQMKIVQKNVAKKRFAHAKVKGKHGGARRGQRYDEEVYLNGFKHEIELAKSIAGLSEALFVKLMIDWDLSHAVPKAFGGTFGDAAAAPTAAAIAAPAGALDDAEAAFDDDAEAAFDEEGAFEAEDDASGAASGAENFAGEHAAEVAPAQYSGFELQFGVEPEQ